MKTNRPTLVSKEYLIPFILITSLFFMWGFARSFLDVLNKHFQESLDLSKAESSLIQVVVYSAYFLLAIPAGMFISRRGYRNGVIMGLSIFGMGSMLFFPGQQYSSFTIYLIALFVIGCGLVFLETAANPYAAGLGDPRTAASRLNLAQSFNGLGCVFGPFIGAQILFSGNKEANVAVPYIVMGFFVLAMAMWFTRIKLPEIGAEKSDSTANDEGYRPLFRNKYFLFGLFALFCYEISEISINTFFINYVSDDGWLTPKQAGTLLALGGLLLFMFGRVIGSIIMSRIAAQKVLLICAIMTVIGSLMVTFDLGIVSKAGLFSCYAFESIMFPTIFALSLNGLGASTKRASSLLMMSPIGGAVGAFLMGTVADKTSISMAFIVPALGYIVVALFAAKAFSKANKVNKS